MDSFLKIINSKSARLVIVQYKSYRRQRHTCVFFSVRLMYCTTELGLTGIRRDPRGHTEPSLPANHRNTVRLFDGGLSIFGSPNLKVSYSNGSDTSMFPFE